MRFWNNKIARVVLVLFLVSILPVYFLAASIVPAPKQMPRAVRGVLDLSGWDLVEDGIVRLDGEWEFYWHQLLTDEDFRTGGYRPDGYIKVPSVWNYHRINGAHLPGAGYATYRLKIVTRDPDSIKALKLSTISTSYRLMVDDALVAANGTVGRDGATAAPAYKPLIGIFQAKPEFDLIVQVANYTYARGGLWNSIYLGTDRQIAALKEVNVKREMFLLGAMLIMALYHAAVFFLQKKYNFRAELYFVCMLLAIILRISVQGEYFILSLFPAIRPQWLIFLEYLTIYWGLVAFAGFIHALYPGEASPRILKAIVSVLSLLTVVTMVTPVAFSTRFTLYGEFLVGLMLLYYLAVTLLAAIRDRTGAGLLLGGAVFLLCIFVHDCLYHWNIITSKSDDLFPLAGFVFIFIQSFILAQRFSTALAENESLSAKLISLNRLKDEFLANTSHELKTPLHGMINITESVLQSAAGELAPSHKDDLSLVVASGRRLANLINDILDYAKLKHGDIQLNKKSVDLRHVVTVVLEVSRHLAAAKPVTLTGMIPDDIPPVCADEDRLTQIIYNLVGNAVKFTARGQISIAAARKNDLVEISVSDTGIGIPGDRIGDIFKSFERLDDPPSKEYGGTGLGLSISKYLVEIHGGKIWVASEPGVGSTFTFSMPVDSAGQSPPRPLPKQEPRGGDRDLQHGRILKTPAVFKQAGEFSILIVDDDYLNLQALVNVLSAEKHTLVAVADSEEALAVISEHRKIDLVILDIMLPKMTGYEVCRQIRREYSLSELPVLMLTAQNSPNGMLEGFAAGANDFLAKPFEASELKARVNTLLQLKKSVGHAVQAEMAFLQAQIKPHFLYNSLNTIASFCWTDPEKAGELLLELSNYLRGSFHFGNLAPFIPLERELEFVQSYLAIEKARFEDRLAYRCEIEGPLDLMVPTLILQPIVENAVLHGILPKPEGGTVAISVRPRDTCILIEVKDDGVGMPPDKIAAALEEKPGGKSVGLLNVDKRMKRIYGHGLEIDSQIGKGTRVSLRITARKDDVRA